MKTPQHRSLIPQVQTLWFFVYIRTSCTAFVKLKVRCVPIRTGCTIMAQKYATTAHIHNIWRGRLLINFARVSHYVQIYQCFTTNQNWSLLLIFSIPALNIVLQTTHIFICKNIYRIVLNMPCQTYELWLGITSINGLYRDLNGQNLLYIPKLTKIPRVTPGHIYVGMKTGPAPHDVSLYSVDQQVGVICQYRPGTFFKVTQIYILIFPGGTICFIKLAFIWIFMLQVLPATQIEK